MSTFLPALGGKLELYFGNIAPSGSVELLTPASNRWHLIAEIFNTGNSANTLRVDKYINGAYVNDILNAVLAIGQRTTFYDLYSGRADDEDIGNGIYDFKFAHYRWIAPGEKLRLFNPGAVTNTQYEVKVWSMVGLNT